MTADKTTSAINARMHVVNKTREGEIIISEDPTHEKMKKKLFFQYVLFLPFVISAVSVVHSLVNESRSELIVYSALSFPVLVGLAFVLFHYFQDLLIEQEQKRLGKKKNTNKREL
ncbi:hypothetical protein [Geomicrobium sp. JCM 19038]|uniref:hypothetical protein n=1 Tax=Geomicrobium sp. JCM 19038 TaxID=1460635 RepID=UPI0005A85D11|nr:hypothetical protein [Geomicrobium sp. JCM 19038]